MVKITYIGNRNFRSLRSRTGIVYGWNKGETLDITDENILAKLEGSRNFVEQKDNGPKPDGGGLRTHVREPKSSSKTPKAKPKSKPKKEVKPKSKAKPKKGLTKSKKGKAD